MLMAKEARKIAEATGEEQVKKVLAEVSKEIKHAAANGECELLYDGQKHGQTTRISLYTRLKTFGYEVFLTHDGIFRIVW